MNNSKLQKLLNICFTDSEAGALALDTLADYYETSESNAASIFALCPHFNF